MEHLSQYGRKWHKASIRCFSEMNLEWMTFVVANRIFDRSAAEMAYYIDETGKRGLKAEGKQFLAWDFDARKFVSSVDDAPPKSRMTLCSEFEANLQ